MKKLMILITLIFFAGNAKSQTVATFVIDKDKGRIEFGADREVEKTIKISVPNPANFKDYKISFSIVPSKTTISIDSIYLPAKCSFIIDKDNVITFKLKFKRDENDDKSLALKLNAEDKDGTPIADLHANHPEYLFYIKPLKSADILSKNSSFWLYTGTNLDLLDGPKLQELYFKGSFLINIKSDNVATKDWFYITFGKNRYQSGKDSVSRQSYSDLDISKHNPDSVYIKSGFYKTVYTQTTDNIFTSIDYLRELGGSEDTRWFVTAGMYFGLQSIKMTYQNTILASYSNSLPANSRPSRLYPITPDNTARQFNYNLSAGLMYKLSNDVLDVRAQLSGGYNKFFYPYLRSITVNGPLEQYNAQDNAFIQIRLEGTVLNPGLSIGIETFIRTGQVPLYNVSLTKVIDLRQLGSLFTKVTSAK